MRRQVLAGVVAIALLTVGCTSSDGGDDSAQPKAKVSRLPTVVVKAGAGPTKVGPVLLDRPAGLSDLTVSAESDDRPGFVPDGLSASGTPVKLTAKGGDKTGAVRVGFRVPKGVDAATVLVANLVDGAWVPQPATYDAQRSAMFAPSDHLGWWTALTGDAGKLTGGLVQAARDLTGTADIGVPPDCGPAPLPPDTVTVELTDVNGLPSGPAARVDSCALVDQGQTKVRLANRRRVAIALDLPSGVTRTGGSLPAAGASSADILTGIDQRFGSPATVLLPAGGTVELAVPPGATTIIGHVDAKVLAWSLLFSAASRVPDGWAALAKVVATPGLLPGNTTLDKTDLLREALSDLLAELAPGGTKLNQTVVTGLTGSVFLEVGDLLASIQPGAGLTITVDAPASDPPAAPGTVCGPLTSGGQPVEVTVEQGPVSCPAAVGIVDTYLNHPPTPPESTSRFVQVGAWGCVASSTPNGGATGSCTGPAGGLITFVVTKAPIDPSSWLITAEGVGPLRVGMTPAEVQALGLATSPQLSTCSPLDPDAIVDGTSAVAWERASQPITALFVTDPRIATATGIRVGSTIDEVRAANPGIPNFPDSGGQNPGYLVDGVAGTGNEVYLHINATSRKVDEIAVAQPTPDRKPLVKLHACS